MKHKKFKAGKCGKINYSMKSSPNLKFGKIVSVNQVNVPDVGRNLVPVWWTADGGEGALPELGRLQ